jgi:hypothetical protein
MASETTTNQSVPRHTTIQCQEMEPLITKTPFADEELNNQLQHRTHDWDTFQFTTFDAHYRHKHNDREWRLFKYDGHCYHQVWRGYIPRDTFPSVIGLRGIIESPNGKSFVIIGTHKTVFVLKDNSYKSGPLLEGARFPGLGKIFYSQTTKKYYGIITKSVSKKREFPRTLTFAEISINFRDSGDVPEDPTYIKQVITPLVSFLADNGRIFCENFEMLATDIITCDFSKYQAIRVEYINYDSDWGHQLNIGDIIAYPLHFDLANYRMRNLPDRTIGKFISVNPANPCEMLYLTYCSLTKSKELRLISDKDGIEIEKTIPFPFNDFEVVSYCIILDKTTSLKYYWDYATRKLIGIRPNRIGPLVSNCSIPGVVYLADRRSIKLFPVGVLDRLVAAGGNLPRPVANIISKFLAVKYK